MGQCMSRKAAGAFAASAAVAHSKPTHKMHGKHNKSNHLSPAEEEDKSSLSSSGNKHSTVTTQTGNNKQCYKGVTTSFGFKRRPTTAPSIASNSNAARRLATQTELLIDRNGNSGADTDSLTSNAAPTGRSTPKLMPPKKEAVASRVNRFGFRQPQINRLNKVADLNNASIEVTNNNVKKKSGSMDSNKNRVGSRNQDGKFLLQSTQLPRPQPVRLIETKTAKTLANNSRKACNAYLHEETSSKDGSLTEDSGVGSNTGSDIPGVDRLNYSPTYGARRSFYKSRNLEIVRGSNSNMFDVRDLVDDENSENCVPLPQLPSAFAQNNAHADQFRGIYNAGFVRERAMEYQQRHLQETSSTYMDNRRKISVTSSESCYSDEEKTCRDKYKNEKLIKPSQHKTFLKNQLKNDSNSSDEQEWSMAMGGEAMADEVSFSLTSSSDESRHGRFLKQNDNIPSNQDNLTTALETLMTASLSNTFNKPEIRNALLIIEDPKFAAVAAQANNNLLDDETSPVDSLLSSDSDEMMRMKKIARSSSNSKDINEKLTPPSPGTPTNASNSLSLSDGKDDYLIDDEIADQPGLVLNHSQNNSESTATICGQINSAMDSTPKMRRKPLSGIDGSPLALRKKKNGLFLASRTGSLDTLSPCESIASDDLMMDFDYSQSSGLEELGAVERNEAANNGANGFCSLDENILRKSTITNECDGIRDWSSLLGPYVTEKGRASNATKASSRLLWSRTGTPNSIPPDSPKSVESKLSSSTCRSRHSIGSGSSPLRLARPSAHANGYDSDDSIRLDRANHSAMKQDIISIKTNLLKLRRILNESETHIPFDGQLGQLTNGLFNGACPTTLHHSDAHQTVDDDDDENNRFELAELRRQVLFLQGQLEDKEKTVQCLQEQMVKLETDNYISNSAPASTISPTITTATLLTLNNEEVNKCNAATQTERIRPISAGPSLLNGGSSPTDGTQIGSLVSASESSSPQVRRCRPPNLAETSPSNLRKHQQQTSKLWRQPGEPPSPQRFTHHSNSSSSIPRRANSRTRTPSVPS